MQIQWRMELKEEYEPRLVCAYKWPGGLWVSLQKPDVAELDDLD